MNVIRAMRSPGFWPRWGAKIFSGHDPMAAGLLLLLLSFGLIMMTTASVALSEKNFGEPFHYFYRQGFSCFIGVTLALIITRIPLRIWHRFDPLLLLLGLVMLMMPLMPEIGMQANGSARWIDLGPVALQPSEPFKFFILLYIAGYLDRRHRQLRETFIGFFVPASIVAFSCFLLLMEPDFGTSVVIASSTMGMLFIGGVSLWRFVFWLLASGAVFASLIAQSSYRMQRMLVFLDPWSDPFNHGFQLTQALIAYGRGGWFGEGLGSGLQKLFYLPEAHTDFIFAVISEELGLIAGVILIAVFYLFVRRAFQIGIAAERSGNYYAAYIAYGCGLFIGVQAFFNLGVNLGVLPTKGLTLPFISYGNNSIIVCCMLGGLLLRVPREMRSGLPADQPDRSVSLSRFHSPLAARV